MFQAQATFTKDQLSTLLSKGLSLWKVKTTRVELKARKNSARRSASLTISADIDAQLPDGQLITLCLSEEVVAYAIAEASAAEGTFITPTMLRFTSQNGLANCLSTFTGASANVVSSFTPLKQSNIGQIQFPGKVWLSLSAEALKKLLLSAVQRDGMAPGICSINHHEPNGVSARVSLTLASGNPGFIDLMGKQVDQAIIEELVAQKFSVVEGSINYWPADHSAGSSSKERATVVITAITSEKLTEAELAVLQRTNPTGDPSQIYQ
jgi:hypothetical protein